MNEQIHLEKSWLSHLEGEFEKTYMKNLRQFLVDQIEQGVKIYPHGEEIFNAFNTTPLTSVKVVIIGQDPYHGPGQAHGLSFSVKEGVGLPPSLKNIFKELSRDLGIPPAKQGNLIQWARQGVLLLNSVLTVEHKKAGSHQGKGWEQFTDKVIEVINRECNNCVFILWGSPAQKKAHGVDSKRHLILKSPHPSPLSAHRGFWGQDHFSLANKFLEQKGRGPIDWNLSES